MSYNILAIHAHPDDIEILCGGLLLKLKEQGCALTMVTMTAGDCGSAEHGQEAISTIRRNEAQKSAEMIGADYHCLEFLDLSIVIDNPGRWKVTELIRRVRPDIVLTSSPVDYMSDHEMTSRLVRDACFNASVDNYRTHAQNAAPPSKHVPYLYYMDAVEGIDLYGDTIPTGFLVDISSEMETKLDMLACHESQRSWLQKQHGMDEYLDSCRDWSRKRGQQMGTEYAEAFRQHKGHPHPARNILAEILPDSALKES